MSTNHPMRDEVEKALKYLNEALASDREMLDDEQPHSDIHDPDDEETRVWEAENVRLTNAENVMNWINTFITEEMDETGDFEPTHQDEEGNPTFPGHRDPIDEVEAYRG